MQKYFIPETTCLTLNAQTIICTSPSPEPTYSPGQLGNMSQTTGSW